MNKPQELNTSDREIILFYIPGYKGDQTLAHAKGQGIPVRDIDISKTPLTGTQLLEIADKLQTTVEDLVDKEHDVYENEYAGQDFDQEDWIKVLQKHPELLRSPIGIKGDKAILVDTPTDIIHLFKRDPGTARA